MSKESIRVAQCISVTPITITKENQTAEAPQRIGLAWSTFRHFWQVFCNRVNPFNLNRRVFENCILPVVTNVMDTMTLMVKSINKLEIGLKD